MNLPTNLATQFYSYPQIWQHSSTADHGSTYRSQAWCCIAFNPRLTLISLRCHRYIRPGTHIRFVVQVTMADTRPIDRLRIQGNAPVLGDKMTKKFNTNSGQLTDIAAPGNPRRYLFQDRMTWSDYGSRSNGQDPYQMYLNIRGRTIWWYSEVTSSSTTTQQPLLTHRRNNTQHAGANGVDTVLTNSDSSSEVTVLSPGNGQLNQTGGNIEPPSLSLTSNQHQNVNNQQPGLNHLKRDNRLRHSYHGVGSLSLTGQKLTTPRDCLEANDRLKNFSFPRPVAKMDQTASESMPDISASSPVHRRHDRVEAAPLVTTQRHTRSGSLRQCLQIQRPKLSETFQATDSVDSTRSTLPNLTTTPNNSTTLTNATTLTNSATEIDTSAVPKKYRFNSVDSYLNFNSKFSKPSLFETNGSSVANKSTIRLMSQLSDMGTNKLVVKAQYSMINKQEVPVSFPTVKRYPNFNGHLDVSCLSVVGSAQVGKCLQDNDQNLKNSAAMLNDLEVKSKETIGPEDTIRKLDGVISDNKEMEASLVLSEPNVICTPLNESDLQHTEEIEHIKILNVRKVNNLDLN
ncbi:hypothetical protein Btru_000655 [Bulinus truncatus]|nr:hypothetical protein Btru_000655 [Bulinus truncatus]